MLCSSRPRDLVFSNSTRQRGASERVWKVFVLVQTRAMETAVGAFGGPVWHEGDAELPLMAEVAGGKFSTAHPAVSSRGTVPFVAYELCREHLGKQRLSRHLMLQGYYLSGMNTLMTEHVLSERIQTPQAWSAATCRLVADSIAGEHPCDKRRSLNDYRQEFPGIDFSQVQCSAGQVPVWSLRSAELLCWPHTVLVLQSTWANTAPACIRVQVKDEEDVLWKADVRETDAEIAERGYRFLQVRQL